MPGQSRVIRVTPSRLDNMTGILRVHLADFDGDYSHLHEHGGLFVIDLWVHPVRRDMGADLDIWDEIVDWLDETGIEHEWHVLTLCTRLVAIRDPDAAFLFVMRFR